VLLDAETLDLDAASFAQMAESVRKAGCGGGVRVWRTSSYAPSEPSSAGQQHSPVTDSGGSGLRSAPRVQVTTYR
jgi:hypothetical protein